MTSENELGIIKTIDINENQQELPNDISSNKDQPSIQEPIGSKIEDEQINIEKPKRPGRKKRDATSTENSNNDNAVDTQPLFEQPIILEGKRSRKPTSRLELSDLETPKKELSIPQGHGKPLGEIEYINYQILQASNDALSRMRNICFGRRSSKNNVRKNLQDFNGFEFERNSDEYRRHLSSLTKLKKEQLRSILDILGLPVTGGNDEQAERILNFLMEPIDEGKTIPERKLSMRSSKQSSTNSKESIHTDEEENDIENGGGVDNDDEIFEYNDEEEEEKDTDDDYIGSDDDSGLNTKDDDPDDFVYQPGKKIPKKRPSIKRSRSGTNQKRKRGASTTTSKRGRKKSKIIVNKTVENEDISAAVVSPEPIQTNNKNTENIVETKNNDLNNIDTTLPEQHSTATNNTTTDIIPATS